MSDALISPEYLEQCRRLHSEKPKWGSYAASKHADRVRFLATIHWCETVLDYGCGKGSLRKALGETVANYDPATFPDAPSPADLVCCLDVLEHIEPEYLDAVLSDLARLTRKVCFAVISMEKAAAILPDGRNAHLIVERPSFWKERLYRYFEIVEMLTNTTDGGTLHVLLKPKAAV